MNDQKMKALTTHTRELMKQKRNILGICLGYQVIAKEMGMEIEKLPSPTQGVQINMKIDEVSQMLGFYNSFCPTKEGQYLPIIQKENISGFQFHPESIMSENGFKILHDELVRIFTFCPKLR
jgi:phenazine biosynthesis protein phzE